MTILDSPIGSSPGPHGADAEAQLEMVIEAERTRLLRADSLLGCLQIALDPDAPVILPEVHFPDTVEAVRELVAESIRRLDFFQLRKLVHQVLYGGSPTQ